MPSREELPRFVAPMLARTRPMPVGDGWAFEVKFDGMRLQLRRDGRAVCLRSRPGRDCSEEFPELAPIRAALGRHRALLDGELVCLGADGSPDFASLRGRLRASADAARRDAERRPVTFLAFDLLHLDGRSTRELPYERRRQLLLELGLDDGLRWRTPRHFACDSQPVLAATRERGLEGVVAKRLASPYLPGARNGAWIKHKHRRTESFLVSGWSPAEGATPREPAARPDRIQRSAGARRQRPARPRQRPGRRRPTPARGARPAADSARPAHPAAGAGHAGRGRLPRPIPRAGARPDPARRR